MLVNSLIHDNKLKIVSNSWMPFKKEFEDRGEQISYQRIDKGCDQLFENFVVTPHGRISSCCGLTFEHIPEMKIGTIFEEDCFSHAEKREIEDFLKIWIKVDGPIEIIRKLKGEDFILKEIGSISHICQSCVHLHKNKAITDSLKKEYQKFLPEVMLKYNAMKIKNHLNRS